MLFDRLSIIKLITGCFAGLFDNSDDSFLDALYNGTTTTVAGSGEVPVSITEQTVGCWNTVDITTYDCPDSYRATPIEAYYKAIYDTPNYTVSVSGGNVTETGTPTTCWNLIKVNLLNNFCQDTYRASAIEAYDRAILEAPNYTVSSDGGNVTETGTPTTCWNLIKVDI